MNLYGYIRDRLINNPVLSGIIGEKAYNLVAPDDVSTPYIVYYTVSQHQNDITEMFDELIQFDIFTDSLQVALSIKKEVQNLLCFNSHPYMPLLTASIENAFPSYETGFKYIMTIRFFYMDYDE